MTRNAMRGSGRAPAVLNPWPDVNLAPPDLSNWRAGNTGIPGFVTLAAARPGPHLGILSLVHGNEFAGAIALDRLLRRGISPLQGRLTVGFANLDAFDRFDPAQPTAARFIDEDLNRVWDPARLHQAPASTERRRAAAMLPLVTGFDHLLDLHSMLWPGEPLILISPAGDGARLASSLRAPYAIVTDPGHTAGPRLIDHPHFAGRAQACLFEAGSHWQPETVDVTERAILNMLHHLGMLADPPATAHGTPMPVAASRPLRARVTEAITPRSNAFAFRQAYVGGTVIPHAGTLIARDGEEEIRTPYDNCLLVMPSQRPSPGHTAVRLARPLP